MPPSEHLPPPSSPHDMRIEQLLVTGLDHYFAGQFERAIQVWSRVFFLDRGHARARAYIDRARGALAERQREAEARLHRADGPLGHPDPLEAHAAIDVVRRPSSGPVVQAPLTPPSFARPSLSTDVSNGAAAGTARARVVDVERFAGDAPRVAPEQPAALPSTTETGDSRSRSWHVHPMVQVPLVALAALLLFGAGYVVAARDRLATWWSASSTPTMSVPAMATDVKAEPARTEQILERARQQLAQGKGQAALRMLSTIAADDPLRAAADRLRADVLRTLSAAGAGAQPPSGSAIRGQGSASR